MNAEAALLASLSQDRTTWDDNLACFFHEPSRNSEGQSSDEE